MPQIDWQSDEKTSQTTWKFSGIRLSLTEKSIIQSKFPTAYGNCVHSKKCESKMYVNFNNLIKQYKLK